MLGKILRIFRKDAKIATRDSMMIYIIVIPVLIALGILFLAPGITDSSMKVAMLDSDDQDHITYMGNYVQVELFDSVEEVERRVLKRDDIPGIIPSGDGYEIVVEGNEAPGFIEGAQRINVFYELGATKENTTAQVLSFEKSEPPLKGQLTNMLILMIIMLSGMIISLGIVEEKSDNTVSAMNVTPVTQNSFIMGKSLLGGVTALVSIVISLLILGYNDINWWMIILIGLTTMILTFVVGFIQGVSSSDVIEAAAGVKLLLLPMAGSIAGYELLSANWQWTMYWSPFYWAYKANDLILSKTALWSEVLLYGAIVFGISIVIYILVMPRIRKGLSKA
ncbi:MAG: ABC transporter permease [Clostridium sp.]|nr:ABC transporter permease [Clostridium sp.]